MNLSAGSKILKSRMVKFDESMEALQNHWLLKSYFKKLEKGKGE
ncbi:hypothetical protein [Fulvivirga sp.]